jgi:hypothetical protein
VVPAAQENPHALSEREKGRGRTQSNGLRTFEVRRSWQWPLLRQRRGWEVNVRNKALGPATPHLANRRLKKKGTGRR